LSEEAFDISPSKTAKNLQEVLVTIPGGTQFSVVPNKREKGLVNLMQGDQVVSSFDVRGINQNTKKLYLNQFSEIISNLAGMNGMTDYLGRSGGLTQSQTGTGGVQQSGGLNYSDF
jgi:hypothetical protein